MKPFPGPAARPLETNFTRDFKARNEIDYAVRQVRPTPKWPFSVGGEAVFLNPEAEVEEFSLKERKGEVPICVGRRFGEVSGQLAPTARP